MLQRSHRNRQFPSETSKSLKEILTRREIEIIQEIARGNSIKEIGNILFLSEHTVQTHKRNILKKSTVKIPLTL
ncbi:helix-turn-helix transcriptional regulator [Christiangramia fulva]|uniref:Helix-turn-helix transcriptional regulator n=1 Tax=Christiangramia fulva TaxID=2126553 RepID=A0A2R3Z2V7_9FLAO|nr:helix-turn-helix transcriptional regulator [Christiangramia fulva]